MRFANVAVIVRFSAGKDDKLVVFRNQKWSERLSDKAAPAGQDDSWFHNAAFP
jgi:hypothetical protein